MFFLCSCGVTQSQKVQESGRKTKTFTSKPTKIPKETTLQESDKEDTEEQESYEYIEKKDIKILGRHYKYAAYAKSQSGKIYLFALQTKEKILYIPAEIEGCRVVGLGAPVQNTVDAIPGLLWQDTFDLDRLEWNWGKKQRLKKVVISDGIERIDDLHISADEIIIPKSVRELGDYAGSFTAIKRVVVKSKRMNLGSDAFYNSKLEQIEFPDDFKGVIGSWCFKGSNLKSFRWPAYGKQKITDINPAIFQECKKLKQVIFPENQECIYIPERTFWQCTKLRQLEFPASTKKVIYKDNYYADNYKHGISTLVFKGKDTQIEGGDIHGIASIAYTPEHFISVSKIIAPQDSEAIRFAKKAVKISHLKDWKPDEATCENDLDFQKITKEDLVPVEYEIRN